MEWVIIKEKLKIFLSIVALLTFIIVITVLSMKFPPHLRALYQRQAQLKAAVARQGARAIAAFIGVQVLQVVVAGIPGEVVQVAGGYLFGPFWGSLFLVSGLVIGSLAAFFAARLLGAPLLRLVVPGPKRERLLGLLCGARTELIIFFLYLVPGLPKDALTYVAGLTPINPWRFLAISTLGRLPALVVSCYLGASLGRENLRAVVIITSMSVAFMLVGFLSRKKIFQGIMSLTQRKGDRSPG